MLSRKTFVDNITNYFYDFALYSRVLLAAVRVRVRVSGCMYMWKGSHRVFSRNRNRWRNKWEYVRNHQSKCPSRTCDYVAGTLCPFFISTYLPFSYVLRPALFREQNNLSGSTLSDFSELDDFAFKVCKKKINVSSLSFLFTIDHMYVHVYTRWRRERRRRIIY